MPSQGDLGGLAKAVADGDPESVTELFKQTESRFSDIEGASKIRSAFAKVRREFRDDQPDRAQAAALLDTAMAEYAEEVGWRRSAVTALGANLADYDEFLKDSIGLRLQPRLSVAQAEEIASCKSNHQDISLYF